MTDSDVAAIAAALHRSRMATEIVHRNRPAQKEAALGSLRLAVTDIAATLAASYPVFDKAAFVKAAS